MEIEDWSWFVALGPKKNIVNRGKLLGRAGKHQKQTNRLRFMLEDP